MEAVNAARKKFQCSDPACKKDRVYFCKSHQMKACRSCASKMHFRCQLDIIHDLTDLNVDVIEAKRFVKRLFELIAENGLRAYSPNIDSELKDFQDSLVEVEKKIRDAITHDHYEQFDTLQTQIKHVQIQMSDSNAVKDIFYFSALRDVSLYSLPKIGKVLSSSTKVKEKIDAVVKENVELMEKKFRSKSRHFEQQCKDRLTEEFKDEIQNLKDQNDAKDTELEEQREVTEQAHQDTKKQRDEALAENATLQDENKDLKDFKTQLEEDLKAKLEEIKESKLQHDKDQEEISKLCEEVKESHGQLEEARETLRNQLPDIFKNFNPNSKDLVLNMSQEQPQKLVKAMGDSKYPLPNMNRLKLDYIYNQEAILNPFMQNSVASPLKLFNLNCSFVGSSGSNTTEASGLMKGLKSLLPNVTKEVFLWYLIVSEDALSQIVKASSNAQRLTVGYSKINLTNSNILKIQTSDSLDFTSAAQSKLEYLSFRMCAYDSWCNQEWDKYPDRFEKIVVAIKNSSLKDSLKTLNVYSCKISPSKVGEQLETHGLSHISVVQENNLPLTE
ncbi:unnamed protein product [Moneuplotes crassus]|uniref:Uncharacterized protein n=1 Tax=Euplotes crassus TaxID=5936 RepID=A0AAD1Y528_EUPCR|nr:unnamed protein product [Moneuplotes crassus]